MGRAPDIFAVVRGLLACANAHPHCGISAWLCSALFGLCQVQLLDQLQPASEVERALGSCVEFVKERTLSGLLCQVCQIYF